MSHKVLIGGTAREVTGGRVLIGGAGREIASGKALVGGTAYNISFVNGKKASEYAIGSSVYLYENGTKVEYLVVHQGIPSSAYASSCNGTWLLRKNIRETRVWKEDINDGKPANDYGMSSIYPYLNSTYLALFDSKTQSAIIEARVPFHRGATQNGDKGAPVRVFLLSCSEVGFPYDYDRYIPQEGATLSYFSGAESYGSNVKRVATYNGSAHGWWLRTHYTGDTYGVWFSNETGSLNQSLRPYSSLGVRPALILNSSTEFDADTNIILT